MLFSIVSKIPNLMVTLHPWIFSSDPSQLCIILCHIFSLPRIAFPYFPVWWPSIHPSKLNSNVFAFVPNSLALTLLLCIHSIWSHLFIRGFIILFICCLCICLHPNIVRCWCWEQSLHFSVFWCVFVYSTNVCWVSTVEPGMRWQGDVDGKKQY